MIKFDLFTTWINYETGDEKKSKDKYGNPCPHFRKTFELTKKVKKAQLVFSVTGLIKVYINGEPLDNDYLSPGWTDYHKRMPAMCYDITDRLQAKNAIGIVCGDGWAVGNIGAHRNNWFPKIFVLLQLDIEYTDGTSERICSDDSWKCNDGAIRCSDIYMGEYIDNRKDLGNFSLVDYDDSDWHGITEQKIIEHNRLTDKIRVENTVVKHILKPEYLYTDKNGKKIYDFKQNMVGVISAVIKGESGAKIIFRHGEMLNTDGTLYTENLRTAEATDTFILSGNGEEKFRPLFTFHGFRYAEITIEGNAEILEMNGEVMYTDLKQTGNFSCSDDNVNKLYSNIVWGQRSNFINVPTDCPQRDERLGWTADAQIFSGTAMFNMDCKRFFEKYMCDLRDAQIGNGGVPSYAPSIPGPFGTATTLFISAGWADAVAVISYEHYLMYGDKQILFDSICAMKRMVDYFTDRSENYLLSGFDIYGDWLSVNANTDGAVISSLYYAYSTLLTAKVCEIIGDLQSKQYYELYANIKKSFLETLVDGNNIIKSDTQTCYLLAYSFGIMTKEQIRDNLVRKIKEADYHLSTGFLGVKFLLPVLCEIGETELAYRLLTTTTYPSWCYSVVNGATTIWERWNSYSDTDGFGDVGMNSFNHYSLGSCGEWMYKYCLGINPSEKEAGFDEVIIRPFVDFSGKINHAEGYYDTKYGRITAKWRKTDENTIEYSVEIPEKIHARYDFTSYNAHEISSGVILMKKGR